MISSSAFRRERIDCGPGIASIFRLSTLVFAAYNTFVGILLTKRDLIAVEAEQTMDVDDEDEDDAATTASTKQRNNFRSERNEKQKKQKASRIQKGLRHRKPRNQIVFAKTGKARKGGKR